MPKSFSLVVAFVALLVGGWSSVFAQQATVNVEKQQVFRTCPFGDPDPVARMTNIHVARRGVKHRDSNVARWLVAV